MDEPRNNLLADGRFSPQPQPTPQPETRYHVPVDMPEFSKSQIEAWFFKIHAVFRRYYVTTEKDRKAQFLGILPCNVFGVVADFFDFDPPTPGQVMLIIQKILQLYAPSDQGRKKQEIQELVRRVALDQPETKIYFPARTKCGQLLPRKILPRRPNWVLMFGQLRTPDPSTRMSPPARIRRFSKKLPEIWFFQTRLMFRMEEVTNEEDKYLDVVACLPDDVILYVTDILEDPPERPYVQLLARLFYLYAPNLEETERAKWLTQDRMNMRFTDGEEINAILEAFRELCKVHPPRETHYSTVPLVEDDDREDEPKPEKLDLINLYVICRFHFDSGCSATRCALPCNWERIFRRKDTEPHLQRFRKPIDTDDAMFICRYHHKWGAGAVKCTKICNWKTIFDSKPTPAATTTSD